MGPAAALWQPYGNAYGYNNHGQVRSLQVRVDNLQRQIRRLDQRNVLSNREAARLFDDSRDLERRLHRAARNGLSRSEHHAVETRLPTSSSACGATPATAIATATAAVRTVTATAGRTATATAATTAVKTIAAATRRLSFGAVAPGEA